MQITNSVVCGASKGCIHKRIKPPLVGEHAFPLTALFCRSVYVTFGGSGGIRSTARTGDEQIKPSLVGEHAFPLTGFVRFSAHVTYLHSIFSVYYHFLICSNS